VGVRDYLTRFTDRPVRRAYVVVNVDFVRRFKRYFADAKPNAVLSFTQPGHRIPTDIVLQIGQPRWHPKTSTLTFPAVRILKREDNLPDTTVHIKPPLIANPRHFGRASLFIDSAGPAVVSSHLYWSSDIGGTIVEANLDGSNPTTIVTGQNSPVGVAVGGNHLYWANEGTAAKNYTDGTIVEANLDGTNPVTIADGQANPGGLALGPSHLYWANGGTPTVAGSIVEGRGVGGSPPTPIVTPIAIGQNVTGPLGVAVDSSHLYWANQSGLGNIIEANLDGTNPLTIATNQNGPSGVAVGP
jgi:hypothetical protein